tara:strand:- start:406 stop:660 length:255 start_codon:yes stop_codon:yes gene_type:complete
MKWEDILKDEQSYGEMLGLIEKVEQMLEAIHDDIDTAAKKMNEETGYPIEQARKLILNIQKDTISEIEKTLEQYRKELPKHIRE